MTLPDSDHVIWKIVRLIVVAAIMFVMLKYNYANGWASADWLTMIGTLLALGGFDAVKKMAAPKS